MKCKTEYIWASLRIGLGWIFLWAFFDKLLGLGFSTAPDKSWLMGNSPTLGFLKFGTHGPLGPLYQSLAGNPAVDVIFMLGLLLIGAALMLGIGVRIAGYTGALMMFLMWAALLPPEHNPIIDDHIIYLIVLLLLPKVNAGQWYGLGKWWSGTALAKRHKILI